MAIKPIIPSQRPNLRAHLPPAAELHDYQVLCKQALVVIVSFLLLGLVLALVATTLPALMP